MIVASRRCVIRLIALCVAVNQLITVAAQTTGESRLPHIPVLVADADGDDDAREADEMLWK